jgi:hypothetical protein
VRPALSLLCVFSVALCDLGGENLDTEAAGGGSGGAWSWIARLVAIR